MLLCEIYFNLTWMFRLGLLDPEDENSTILRNVGNYLPVYTA